MAGMKICTHCQKQNPDEGTHCRGCGTPLLDEITPSDSSLPLENSIFEHFQPKLVSFAEMGEVFTYSEGYPYPDWKNSGNLSGKNFLKTSGRRPGGMLSSSGLKDFDQPWERIFFLRNRSIFFSYANANQMNVKVFLSS